MKVLINVHFQVWSCWKYLGKYVNLSNLAVSNEVNLEIMENLVESVKSISLLNKLSVISGYTYHLSTSMLVVLCFFKV